MKTLHMLSWGSVCSLFHDNLCACCGVHLRAHLGVSTHVCWQMQRPEVSCRNLYSAWFSLTEPEAQRFSYVGWPIASAFQVLKLQIHCWAGLDEKFRFWCLQNKCSTDQPLFSFRFSFFFLSPFLFSPPFLPLYHLYLFFFFLFWQTF